MPHARSLGELRFTHDHPRLTERFTPQAVDFLVELHRQFAPRRTALLASRAEVQAHYDAGENPDGKRYQLNDTTATLVVRPRGWHLPERHLLLDGQPLSGSLVDFGISFFHNAAEALRQGIGPYFYLPKIEHYLEARLWNDLSTAPLTFASDWLASLDPTGEGLFGASPKRLCCQGSRSREMLARRGSSSIANR